ncbi:MAG: 2-C-methyl-D-erythritol 4-phosphate cytidylyltransferase [Acidobacteriota bacterium]
MRAAAIIPAAGIGTRMRTSRPKQFLMLEEKPIIIHTLRKFCAHGQIQRVIVPIREADSAGLVVWLEREKLDGRVTLVMGGEHRQDSVYNGFKEVPVETQVVIVHDAVRPFVDHASIQAVMEEAAKSGCAILAVPCVDTLKQIEMNQVVATLPRERIVLVQTPQAFQYALLKEGFERALADGFYGTDESILVERLGHPVKVLRGQEHNIKITKPTDLPLAEFYAGQGKM